MSKERELLERALLLLDYSEMRSDSLATEIELCLDDPETKREPLSDYDVCEGYVTTIKEEPWTRIKAYFAGVRFAEEHHGIGGKDE